MTRYEQGFMAKCAEYGIMEKQAFTLLELLTALGLAGAVGLGERAAYKHNPEGYRKGAKAGVFGGGLTGKILAAPAIARELRAPGSMKQRLLRSAGLAAAATIAGSGAGALVGGPAGALGIRVESD